MNNKNDKSKTLIRLGFYMLFLVMVIVLIVTSGVNTEDNSNTKNVNNTTISSQKTYLEKEQILVSGNYNYKFVIDDGVIVFKGVAVNGNRRGTKTVNNKAIEYEKDVDVYIVENGQKKVYEGLYDNIDESLFDFKSLFEKLNVLKCLIDRREEETVYSYKEVFGYNIDITSNKDYIIKIDINGLHKYNMEFTY